MYTQTEDITIQKTVTIQQARKLYKKHDMQVAGDNNTNLLYFMARKKQPVRAGYGVDRSYIDKMLILVVDTELETAEVKLVEELRHVRGCADFPDGCQLHN